MAQRSVFDTKKHKIGIENDIKIKKMNLKKIEKNNVEKNQNELANGTKNKVKVTKIKKEKNERLNEC